MKISLRWLNDYLQPPVSADDAEVLLTAQGFPVEDVVAHDQGAAAGDTMLDVEVTSNRSDCLSHLGVAREIAAGSEHALQLPQAFGEDAPSSDSVADLDGVTVDLQDPAGCPYYTARVIRGVKVGPSPADLVARLEAVGLRSVNNVVDATNFVLHEMGQPLHAFDLGRLSGRRVVVRRAAGGEGFTAIDGSQHKLRGDMLVIADGQRPQAVAGVMGGRDSEVDESTTDILLESAVFEPLTVRTTGRALKLASDSSFRFERGVDPRGVDLAGRRAAEMIVQLAGGTLSPGVIRRGPWAETLPGSPRIELRGQRCRDLLGLDLTDQQQAAYLGRLGLDVTISAARPGSGDQPAEPLITAEVPSYRLDLSREVDLIEEVARLHGLDAIPVRDTLSLTIRPPQPSVTARRLLAETLVAHGYHETVTFSFISPAAAEPFLAADASPLLLEGDHKKDEPMLRPSILPSLLQCRKLNQDAGNDAVRLFETASCWSVHGGETREAVKLALLRDAGPGDGADKGQPIGEAALRGLAGLLHELVERLGGAATLDRLRIEPTATGESATPGLDPAGRVYLGDRPLGQLGLIDDALRSAAGVQTPVAAMELELAPLLGLFPPPRQVAELAKFPGIERDLSLILDESIAWEKVASTIADAQPALLEQTHYLGTYRGKPIPAGQKSVSLRMVFRDPQTTLRHEQVDPQVAAVVTALGDRLGATLRS